MIFEALLKVLGAGLSIWDSKEKSKYYDRYVKLRRNFYAEYAKPDGERDMAVLDNIKFELCLLGDAYSTEVGKSGAKTPKA